MTETMIPPRLTIPRGVWSRVGETLVGPRVVLSTHPKEIIVNHEYLVHEVDERSIQLTEIDLTKVCFEKETLRLSGNKEGIQGIDQLKNLKASGVIRLDADVSSAFLLQHKILYECRLAFGDQKPFPPFAPFQRKGKETDICLHFDGTIFESKLMPGRLFSRRLIWSVGEDTWSESMYPIDHGYWVDSYHAVYRP